MSVGVQELVKRLPIQGWKDPALPIGIWGFEEQAVGDAGGGILSCTAILASASQAKSGSFFSLEAFNLQTNIINGEIGSLNLQGAEFPYAITPNWTFDLTGHGLSSALNPRSLLALPYFLGWQERAATALALGFTIINALGTTFTVNCQGYIWSPRSRAVDGGPRRPDSSIFGH